MNPLFRIDFSISDSLKILRKSVLIYETIIEDVEYYNKICAQQSTRCIFSCDDEFSSIERVLKKNPNVLNRPQTIIEWAGKTFTPNKL